MDVANGNGRQFISMLRNSHYNPPIVPHPNRLVSLQSRGASYYADSNLMGPKF